MLSSDLNKLAASYAQIASEAIDPKGAARMDAAKGKTKETEDETNKRLMLGKYSPGAKNKKVDKCTSESFYLKRLQAMNPVFAEQYRYIAEILIEEGYENSRLIDNIVEAFPPEMVGYEFISALKAVNPRLHENLQSTEKRQAKAIVMHFSEGPELRRILGAIGNKLGFGKKKETKKVDPKVSAQIAKNDAARSKGGDYFGTQNPPKKDTKPATPPSSTVASQQPSTSRPASPPKNQGTGERSAAANDAKQQAAKAAANKSSTPSPSPKPTPKAKPTGPITSRAAIAGGSKEGQGPKSAASTYTGANDKTKVGRYKTLAQHRAAVAANKNSMSEGNVFESLKNARKNVPNCVKEGDVIDEMAPMKHVSTTPSGQKRYSTKDDGRHQRGVSPDGKPGGVNAPRTVGPTGAKIYNSVRGLKKRIGLGDDYQPEGKLLEGIRDKDSEKGTKERKERLEKKRGMKVDDHPEYLETDMKKRQENNEKARKDMDKVKGQKNPHFEDVSHYDVIFAFLSENNLIESVDEAEEIMMQLTGAQIVEIIDQFMNEGADGRVDRAYAVDGHGNKYRDYNNDGVSDRQRRMKAFAGKRTQMLMQPKLP